MVKNESKWQWNFKLKPTFLVSLNWSKYFFYKYKLKQIYLKFLSLGCVGAIDQTHLIHHLSSILFELLLLDMKWTQMQLVGSKILKVLLQQQPVKKDNSGRRLCGSLLQSNKLSKANNIFNSPANKYDSVVQNIYYVIRWVHATLHKDRPMQPKTLIEDNHTKCPEYRFSCWNNINHQEVIYSPSKFICFHLQRIQ